MAAQTVPLRIEQLDFACRLQDITSDNQLARLMGVNRSTVTRARAKGEASFEFIAGLRRAFPRSKVEDFCSFDPAAVTAVSA